MSYWAAVMTRFSVSMEPPQKWEEEAPDLDIFWSETWNGNSPSDASFPPVIKGWWNFSISFMVDTPFSSSEVTETVKYR